MSLEHKCRPSATISRQGDSPLNKGIEVNLPCWADALHEGAEFANKVQLGPKVAINKFPCQRGLGDRSVDLEKRPKNLINNRYWRD